MALMQSSDLPVPIRACWLSWIAVHSSDQAGLVAKLGLTNVRSTTWADGADLIDEVAHAGDDERFSTVVVTPSITGWTLVIGPWCGLPHLRHTALVTNLCRELSSEHGKAQAYFHSEQNDGEAWLIAEDRVVVRRWVSKYPELALGEPFGVERRLLDAFGIRGNPEDRDPEDDLASEWAATWGDCDAPTVAAESSLDPRQIGPQTQTSGSMLLARTPPFEPLNPITGTAPYEQP